MKLNYRDRILLTALIVIAVWVIGIMFFIKPAIEDIGDAQTKLDEAKVTLSDLEQQIDADKDLDARIEEAYEQANKIAMNFYDYQEAQVATQNVDDLLDTDNLTNLNMSISSYSTITLTPYKFSAKTVGTDVDVLVDTYEMEDTEVAEEEEENLLLTPQTIGNYSISFEFKGELDDVKNFCEKLKSNDKKTLVLESIEVKFDDDDMSTVSGNMTLNMIVLKKLSDPSVS